MKTFGEIAQEHGMIFLIEEATPLPADLKPGSKVWILSKTWTWKGKREYRELRLTGMMQDADDDTKEFWQARMVAHLLGREREIQGKPRDDEADRAAAHKIVRQEAAT